MADVEVGYRGNIIRSMSASGEETLNTAGKYCDDNIKIFYTQPGVSGAFTLIDTLTVLSDTRTYNINLSNYNYDMVMVFGENVSLAAQDWLYMVKDGSTPSGGEYTTKLSSYNGFLCANIKNYFGNPTGATFILGLRYMTQSASAANNLFMYCYNSSNVIQAGAKFKIYGCNYSDV